MSISWYCSFAYKRSIPPNKMAGCGVKDRYLRGSEEGKPKKRIGGRPEGRVLQEMWVEF